MFAYCGNDPVCYYDPNGYIEEDALRPWSKSEIAGFVILGGCAIGISTEVSRAEGRPRKNQLSSYYVYVLRDSSGNVQYVGRTRNLSKRQSAHSLNPARRHLTMDVLASGLSYEAARGLEQTYMLYYHTINIENKTNNQINGISPTNSNINEYLYAAQEAVGDYVWNQISNDLLNWLGE